VNIACFDKVVFIGLIRKILDLKRKLFHTYRFRTYLLTPNSTDLQGNLCACHFHRMEKNV